MVPAIAAVHLPTEAEVTATPPCAETTDADPPLIAPPEAEEALARGVHRKAVDPDGFPLAGGMALTVAIGARGHLLTMETSEDEVRFLYECSAFE